MIHKPTIIEMSHGTGASIKGIFIECDDQLDLEAAAWALAQGFEDREHAVNLLRPEQADVTPAFKEVERMLGTRGE